MSEAEEPIRRILAQPDATGTCMDCGQVFTGPVGIRFVLVCGVRGIEVCIIAGNETHAIARVKCGECPTVRLEGTKLRHDQPKN